MISEKELTKLEEDERAITDEAITLMIIILASAKSDLEHELRNFYSKYGRDGVVTYAEARKWVGSNDRRKRLVVLLDYVNSKFSELQNNLTTPFQRMLQDVVSLESKHFDKPLDSDKILEETWGAEDDNWEYRLGEDCLLWLAYISIDIKQLILRRASIDEVIELLNKRFKSMNHVLETLGLSESTAISSMARRQIFKQLGVTKYQFFTKPDERRCETCGAMHGLIFPISAYEVGATASPIHPRCRCWEVPILE